MANYSSHLRVYPCLKISFLARSGFFDADDAAIYLVSHDMRFSVVREDPENLMITSYYDGGILVQRIGLVMPMAQLRPARVAPVKARTLFGVEDRRFFRCDIRNARADTLYFFGEIWASRKGLGLNLTLQKERRKALEIRDALLGTEQRLPAGDKRRARLMEEARRYLCARGLVPDEWIDLEEVFQRESLAERSREARPAAAKLWVERDYHGWLATSLPDFQSYVDRPIQRSPGHVGSPALDLPWAAAESHPTLRSSSLASLSSLSRPGVEGYWMYAQGVRDELYLIIVDTRAGSGQLVIRNANVADASVQIIRLVERPQMPNRRFLECPILGTIHDKLYLRAGTLASAPALRLKNASQLSVRAAAGD